MGYIGNECPSGFFDILQTFCHMVEAFCQLPHFIFACNLYPLFKIPTSNFFCCPVHIHQGLCHFPGCDQTHQCCQQECQKQAEYTSSVHFIQRNFNFRHRAAHENTGKLPFRKGIAHNEHGCAENRGRACFQRNHISLLNAFHQFIISQYMPQQTAVHTGRCQNDNAFFIDQKHACAHIVLQHLHFISQIIDVPRIIGFIDGTGNLLALFNQFLFCFRHIMVRIDHRKHTTHQYDAKANGCHI